MKNLGGRGSKADTARMAWRLETFDLRAGLAFATYRDAQQSSEQEAEGIADWPCFFFSPPDFDPQPVDNIALALASSRGSFDSGLMIGDAEVGFADLSQIAEFVRRAYVASASGDGSDAPGGPNVQPPPLQPDGPNASPFIGDDEKFEEFGLRHAFEFFNSKSTDGMAQRNALAMAFELSWSSLVDSSSTGAAMVRGARHLLVELLDRCPDPDDMKSLLRWEEDLRNLGVLARRCGAFDSLVSDDQQLINWRIRKIFGRMNPDFHLNKSHLDAAISILLLAPNTLFEHEFNDLKYIVQDLYFRGHWTGEKVDPLDSLERWPAPSCTQALGPKQPQGRCSSLALLSAVTSAPEAFAQLDREGQQVAVDIAVFASACLTCLGEISPISGYRWSYRRDLRDAFTRKCSTQATDWLLSQLPRIGFRHELEQRISDSRHLTYGQAFPTATPTPPPASGAAGATKA